MNDRVAMITGSARGLGLTIAQHLAREGMQIVGADIRFGELSEAMSRLAELYEVQSHAILADVTEEAQVARMMTEALDRFDRVDVLVNNAGVRHVSPVWQTSEAAWDRVHHTNLRGHFLCTREVLARSMLERGEGTLVFISSLAGKRGLEGACAYSASKWGLLGFAESVAKDLKKTRIRVTTIVPGRIETPMAHESEIWSLGLDWLDPDHVARAVAFCVKQDPNTIIPELQIFHRAQL